MRGIAEFRVDEDFAPRLLADNEGKRHGDSIRRVELATNDPRFELIGELQRETRAKTDRSFFYGWHIRRQYSAGELRQAKLLLLWVTAVFEPAGEECGTEYDEATACSKCGAGAAQVSDLYLDLRKAPKNREIARTIADEIIVSQRLAEKMIDAGLTGFQFRLVRHKARYEDDPLDLHQVSTGREILRRAEEAGFPHPAGEFYVWLNRAENRALFEQARAENATLKGEEDRRKGKPMPIWHQLAVTATDAEIVPATRVGIDPFDDDPKGECRCPLGDLIGLNLLSEVSIRAASRGDTDVVASRQFIGTRLGVLRPRRAILISPKVWRLTESEKLRGIEIEVAHLV